MTDPRTITVANVIGAAVTVVVFGVLPAWLLRRWVLRLNQGVARQAVAATENADETG